jgi:probable phosphoglycerate mutase
VETVQPLAASRGLEVRTSEALVEMDAGRWTGRTLRSLSRLKLWDVVQRNPSAFVFPNGEGFVEAEARLIDELRRIASRHRGGRVAIGTHGDLVRVAVAHFAGAPLDRFQRVASDPASVSVVRIERGVPRILLVNDTGGLRRFATPAARTRGGSVEGRPSRAPARRKLRG